MPNILLKLINYISLPFRYAEYRLNRVHPLWCTFAVTENCNGRCRYCQYWRRRHADLPTAEVLKIVRRLKQLGIKSIVFSGGECILRPDLAEIVAFTSRLGMEATVVTNGILGSEALYESLMSCGLQGLAFSLDGSSAAVHEAFRNGCFFNKVVAAIQAAVQVRNRSGFPTRIATTTVVNRLNVGELREIFELRKSLGADKNYFQPVWPIYGEQDFHERFGFADMSLAELENLAKELCRIPDGNLEEYYGLIPQLYRDFRHIPLQYRCFAGRAFVYVDSSGGLYPCSPLTHEPMGSLLNDDFMADLGRPELQERLSRYDRYACGGCTMACYLEKNIILSTLQNPARLWRRAK